MLMTQRLNQRIYHAGAKTLRLSVYPTKEIKNAESMNWFSGTALVARIATVAPFLEE